MRPVLLNGPVKFLRLIFLLLTIGSGSISSESVAQQSNIDYQIPRITDLPEIDGNIGELEWAAATRVMLNIETNPGENIPSSVTSEALIMGDGETLYVAFISFDPDVTEIRAYYRDRDDVRNHDQVGIVLDTFNDERRAYEFFVNPFGVQLDAINDDVNNDYDHSWNAIWDSAGRINDDNYTVEIAIPLKQLRFDQSLAQQTWGINFVRRYPRGRDYQISDSARDRNISCYLCDISKAQGFENLERGRNLEVVPTLTTTVVETRDPVSGKWERENLDPDGGLDVRWGINQNLYLNATLNPDFSQVEADRTQLDTNTTFSLFIPERRTFFLDGADYFNSYLNVVHTRNISDPDYGTKLTGKSGNHSYGLLAANDTSTSFLIPGSLGSSVGSLGDVESDISVLRYRYDVLNNSTIGAIVTDRQADGYKNTVTGVDGVFQLTDSDTLSIQSLHSESEYPLAIQTQFGQLANLSDDAHVVNFRHRDSRWDGFATYVDYGKDFRADLGFINQVDYRKFTIRVGHTWRWDDDNFFSRIWFAGDWDKTLDQSGLKLEEEIEFFIEMDSPLQSRLKGLFGASQTYFNGKYFDEQFNQLRLNFRPNSDLFLNLYFRLEDVVDFANTRLGRSVRIGPEVTYNWGPHLQINLDHTLQRFDVDGGRLFTAKLTDARINYQFTTRSFLRFTLQYTDKDRDQSLYVNPVQSRSKTLATQLLYSYRLNAASRFFIGYSDAGFQDDDLDSIESTNRTIFAKLSYAWQL
ncbi:MAG: carbohydrate binding family 9 domain-containing protein [Gammaproteobacteria bacterium]|nr:carbohydrate binding family 9 domain-containing protein [Gammaproteobacteria bacterium]